jgi:fibronectin type 3 domain-containing protein
MTRHRLLALLASAAVALVACQGREPPAASPPAPPPVAPAPADIAPAQADAGPAAAPAAPEAAREEGPAQAPRTEAAAADRRSPAAPLKISAVVQSSAEVVIAWEPAGEGAVAAGYEVFRGGVRVASTAETRAVDRGLRAGTRACYAVRARDAAGRLSEPTPSTCVETPDTTPPEAPPGLAVAAGPGLLTVSWSAASDDVGVVAYEVWRGNERLALGPARSHADREAKVGQEHCYLVRALDRAGNRSAPSGPACAAIPDTTPPSVPSRLVAKAEGETEVALAWEAASDDVGVARYEVSRAGPAGGGPAGSAPGTALRDGRLAVATRYCYSVRACDAAGNCSAASAEACVTTPDLTAPSAPSAVSAAAVSDKAVTLDWAPSTDNVGVVRYEVRRGAQVLPPVREALLRDEGLRPAVEYCYTVVAYDAAGLASAPSARACARTPDLTPPTPPGRLAAVPVSASQVFVAWDPSADDVGVEGYEVLRGGTVVARVAATRAREFKLEAEKEYCYAVRAFDAAGNRSEPAGPACATTVNPSQLSAPSDLRVQRVSETNVLLQWEPSEATGVLYRVYAQGNKRVGLTSSNTFTPGGAMGAQANCYRVAAFDSEGRESPRSNEICARLARTATAKE